MDIQTTAIKELFLLKLKSFDDARGSFVKTFNYDFFADNGLDIEIKEVYFSTSHKDVIRGMHFQTPPHEHTKIVFVTDGEILDVVLDLRKNSKTYGQYYSTIISKNSQTALIIPHGIAHGFKSLKNNTNVMYMQTTCYAPTSDTGIRYDSFGFEWNCAKPILSERDLSFKKFKDFDTPFEMKT